jgi:carbamoyltransferase
MRTEMDYLVVEDMLLSKADQPEFDWARDESWKDEFELD